MQKKLDNHHEPKPEKERQITRQDDGAYPNRNDISGDSVDELRKIEEVNMMMGEKEIGQQNENL
ncbi:hypothetical protein FZC66_06565 [Priestia megaterium]|nr:hypothetical protein FZC66_06565 [Priestia megaterium]